MVFSVAPPFLFEFFPLKLHTLRKFSAFRIPWRIVHTLIRFRNEDAAKAVTDEFGADAKPGSCIGFVR